MVTRFDVYLVSLDPSQGHEMNKTRPAVVVSPDELNEFLGTAIVAPLTSVVGRKYPYRLDTHFEGREGQVALDQIRAVDKVRLVKKLGRLRKRDQEPLLSILREMFT